MDIAKLAGVDAIKLVVMIVQASQTVRHNKKTCQQLVQHVQIIGDLLKKLQASEMMQQPEIRNGLSELEQILREAYMLVTSCQNNNYVYHLFMAAKQADQFRVLQNRLNSCLQVFPLISHIDTTDHLDQILEIIRPQHSQAVKEVPRLFTGCSSCDTRTEVYGEVKKRPLQLNCAEPLKFSLTQLVDATNKFSDQNQIGQGSFGCVYKESQRILVYEYMANGSLDNFISGTGTGRLFLDWPARSRIMKGVAEGLLYLHKHCGLHVIHGDLKPSNILLDLNLHPKISDFGLARTYSPGVEEEFADRIVGSIGFTAPECRERRIFSIKSDVYGFGALLLEIVSGRRCFSLASGESGDDHGFLNRKAWRLWRAGRLIKLFHSPLGNESERTEILRCIQIALLCVEQDPANRPTMQEVVLMLSCHDVALPMPQRPAYLTVGKARAH
ncbi:cysteine-rich receptor-like protein kinase 15 isoform X2 [Setaria italica]|uniref:cysteine-rich receptor-like protein kinase 15 isoform X2 n=1 Tax=Setaria italica TaxID=4555 RepID=UPI000350A7B9|nr:cysteine-rich receptor-like protein kinase 15 isoform X2 [Setaria italica]